MTASAGDNLESSSKEQKLCNSLIWLKTLWEKEKLLATIFSIAYFLLLDMGLFHKGLNKVPPSCIYIPGSLRAKQPTFSPFKNGAMNLSFCSALPKALIGPRYKDCIEK